jgi:hypothetical protein
MPLPGRRDNGRRILSRRRPAAADPRDQRGETTAGPCGGGSQGRTCSIANTANSVFVQTRNNGGTPAEHAFYVAVLG